MKRVVLFFTLLLAAWATSDDFREHVSVRPLADGKVQVLFEFNTTASAGPTQFFHFHLFPMTMGLLMQKFNFTSLQLTLAAGRWYAEQWGVEQSYGPTGLAVRVEFGGDDHVGARWVGLLHSLGGLLCASVHFASRESNTVVEGPLIRSAMLARESVCTENLTPWLTLLPCRGEAGFGAAISATHVFDSCHHTIGLSVARLPSGDVRLRQWLLYVKCESQSTWNHRALFGSVSTGGLVGCPLASQSVAHVDRSLRPDATGTPAGSHHMQVIPLLLDVHLPQVRVDAPRPPLQVVRYVSGVGQERGTVVSRIAWGLSRPVELQWVETIPSFARAYFHTLRVAVDGRAVSPRIVSLVPSSVNGAPARIHLSLSLAGSSVATVEWDFRKALLPIADHPPDAHHGLYIPAAVAWEEGGVRVFSDVLVVLMPLPDFSMPFNVVALTGILLGFYFGAMLRAVTARYSGLKQGNVQVVQSQRPIARLSRFLLRLIDGE